MKLIALAAAALLALPAAACTGSSDDGTEIRTDQGSVTASGSGEDAGVTFEGADGSTVVTGAAAEGAASGPAYARPYPGSRIVSAVAAGGDQAGMTTFQTDADPATVVAYYRERAEEAGLASGADMTMGDTRQYAAEAENGAQLSVIVAPQDGQSTVTVAWQAAS